MVEFERKQEKICRKFISNLCLKNISYLCLYRQIEIFLDAWLSLATTLDKEKYIYTFLEICKPAMKGDRNSKFYDLSKMETVLPNK